MTSPVFEALDALAKHNTVHEALAQNFVIAVYWSENNRHSSTKENTYHISRLYPYVNQTHIPFIRGHDLSMFLNDSPVIPKACPRVIIRENSV